MGALDLKVVALNRIITSNIMDDMKSKIVGQSWCKLAQRMEQWSAWDTADNRGQQPEGTFSALTNNKTLSEDNRLRQSLLESGQCKLQITTHPTRVESPSSGPGIKVSKETMVDLGKLDKGHRKEDEQQSQGPAQPNNKREQFYQSELSPPHQLCLIPTKRVSNHTGRGSNTFR